MDDPLDPTTPAERWHQGPTFGAVQCSALETFGVPITGGGLQHMRYVVSVYEVNVRGALREKGEVYDVQTPEGHAELERLIEDLGRARDWVALAARPPEPPESSASVFARRLAGLMSDQGISTEQLAEQSGVPLEVVSKCLRHNDNLLVNQAAAMALVLGVDLRDLLW